MIKSSMNLKTGLIFLIICLALQVQGSKEIPNKINRGETKHLADAIGSEKSERTTKRSRISTIRRIFDMAKHRTKRSSFFSTGVKVCPQESVKQILASHQAYYRLRVCQEAVWEAFRIFLDRIPDATEYQNWVAACQRETFCIFDIGKNFSNSQEHLEIIQRRVKHRTFQDRKEEISTEKTSSKKSDELPSFTPAAPPGTLVKETANDTKVPVKDLKPEIPNRVSEVPGEQMVEFSVTLTNQEYTPELSDPTSPQYQKLAAKFQLQMQKIFEKLAGFKEIRVLGFRQKKEKDGSSSTVARYVVNFGRDESEVKRPEDDISTIGSNKIESEKDLLSKEGEITVIKPKVTDLQQMVAIALQEDKSLSMDLGTLQFADELNKPSTDVDNDIKSQVTEATAEAGLTSEAPLVYPSPVTATETLNEIEDTNLIIDYPLPTMPFNVLDSTGIPPKPGDSDSPPPADQSASNDLSLGFSELPTEQSFTFALFTAGIATLSEVEKMKGEIFSTDSQIFPETDIKITVELESSGDDISATLSTMPNFIESLSFPTSLPEEDILVPTDQIVLLPDVTAGGPSIVIDESFEATTSSWEATAIPTGFDWGVQGIATDSDIIDMMSPGTTGEMEDGSGYYVLPATPPAETTPTPSQKFLTTSSMTTAPKSKELVVFFSLRVTNMHFSDDLFNRSSAEYKALEQQFLQLLLPYLQSNLTGFKQLEILNFRNGSVIVNSKMKFAKSVPYNITEAIHCVLEDFCDAAAQRLNLEIDSYSLDIEPADQADPCKFMACDEFSHCIKNEWTKEADCLCKPGYVRKDGQPCRSMCEIEPNLCINGGKCELVPGRGAVCRCPVLRNRREHCAKYAPVPTRSIISKAVILGSLCFIFLLITLIIKLRRKCKNKLNLEDSSLSRCNTETAVRINPVFEHDEPISSFCHGPCSVSACVSSSESIDQEMLQDHENQREHGGHQIQND
ncbi:interphotoreceptor matrix proteoglycan 1 isoform X3 [Sphaerodactylus townsendi]|uniref:interphotoreceptor matrix proteoglycan 1 isoform X3 n=1 Tax=Sphaerodactylus townsendi TaxID=933632 RepID=UPI002026EAF4|nr:interphotoreceptor matrix proteoglycan 1 isoform X3 [Sphaerodactylus townsendi]